MVQMCRGSGLDAAGRSYAGRRATNDPDRGAVQHSEYISGLSTEALFGHGKHICHWTFNEPVRQISLRPEMMHGLI